MNHPTCNKCDCVAGCQSRERLCPNLEVPEQPAHHDLQKQLADLHQYEEIAEFYAQCAISPEALRDWVAERMPAIAQPKEKL